MYNGCQWHEKKTIVNVVVYANPDKASGLESLFGFPDYEIVRNTVVLQSSVSDYEIVCNTVVLQSSVSEWQWLNYYDNNAKLLPG